MSRYKHKLRKIEQERKDMENKSSEKLKEKENKLKDRKWRRKERKDKKDDWACEKVMRSMHVCEEEVPTELYEPNLPPVSWYQ